MTSRRIVVLMLSVGLAMLFQPYSSIHAEPAPAAEEELHAQSDLIVEVDVCSVLQEAPGEFCALLVVRRTIKGKAPGKTIPYRFVPPMFDMPGEINRNVFAGQQLRLFLIFENGRYVAWATNSIEPLTNFPEQRWVLPEKVGEVYCANGKRFMRKPCRNRSAEPLRFDH